MRNIYYLGQERHNVISIILDRYKQFCGSTKRTEQTLSKILYSNSDTARYECKGRTLINKYLYDNKLGGRPNTDIIGRWPVLISAGTSAPLTGIVPCNSPRLDPPPPPTKKNSIPPNVFILSYHATLNNICC